MEIGHYFEFHCFCFVLIKAICYFGKKKKKRNSTYNWRLQKSHQWHILYPAAITWCVLLWTSFCVFFPFQSHWFYNSENRNGLCKGKLLLTWMMGVLLSLSSVLRFSVELLRFELAFPLPLYFLILKNAKTVLVLESQNV